MQARVIRQALHRHRNHFSIDVIGPGTADFLCLEGVVFGAVPVNDLDVSTTLFGPQAMGRDLGGKQQAEQCQGFEWVHGDVLLQSECQADGEIARLAGVDPVVAVGALEIFFVENVVQVQAHRDVVAGLVMGQQVDGVIRG
ncbi:hypothetical protein D3C87_1341260 [compost metagenome]